MCDSIRVLREEGYAVFTVDGNPKSPGFARSDGYEPIDFTDVDAVVEYAQRIDADLILGVNEPGVWTAAQASARLGLPNVPPDVAWRCLHKGQMRRAWDAARVPQPTFRIVEDLDDVSQAAEEIGYPIVLKPTFGWGSRGVSVARSVEDLAWSCEFARTHSRRHDFIVEEKLHGTEITIEGLVQDGHAHVLAISDKEHQPHERYRVAVALNYPAALPPSVLEKVEATVKAAVAALGLENGGFHSEGMVNDDGVFLLELGARGGGGHIFGVIVEAVSGVRMPVALVKILLGKKLDVRPRYQRGACYRFFFAPPSGVFLGVNGVDEARKLPGILDLGFEMEPGTASEPVAGDADRPGYLVSTGMTRMEAMANAERAIASVQFVMA